MLAVDRPAALATCTLDLEACCATARPADGGATFAVGTYTLVDQQRRTGVLYFFDAAAVCTTGLQPVAQVRTSGIFDARWGPGDTVALACSDGIVELCPAPGAVEASQVSCALGSDAGASMCTSVDWRGSSDRLVACGQDGQAHLLQLREAALTVESSWVAHRLEAWVTRASATDMSIVYTGADDSAFKCWDVRAPLAACVFHEKAAHHAGVCAIEVNPHRPWELATGSYDERIRFWDMRQIRTPVCCAEIPCGGGVWRLAWHPVDSAVLLAACMQQGFAIVRDGGVFLRYGDGAASGEHGSLGYGVAWCSLHDGRHAAVSCSFYDRSVHVWEPLVTQA